jgi:hypothetical protein
MATYSLVEQKNVEAAALVGLALNAHEVPVPEQFWFIPEGTHQLYLAVVTPLADKIGIGESFRLIYDALDKETFVTRGFLRSQLIILGEQQSKLLLDRIHAGATSVSRVGQYENAEVFPVPPASEIQKNGFLHLRPLAHSTNSEFFAEASFAPFGPGGFIPTRKIKNQEELEVLFQGLNVRAEDRKQTITELEQGRTSSTLLVNISLDVLYRLGLV